MSSESEFQIQKEPVHGRDDSPIKMLAGLSIGQIAIVMLVGIGALLLFRKGQVAFGLSVLTYAHFRYLQARLPDNFFKNAWQHYTRKHEVYRAGERDYEWRPPIIQRRSSRHTSR